MILRVGRAFVLKSHLEIRFLGVVETMDRIIKLWDCLSELHQCHYEVPFPLATHKDVIEQVYGILQQIRFVQHHSQTEKFPVACTTLLMMAELKSGILKKGKAITIREGVTLNDIHPEVEVFRASLDESLNKRFYNRYSVDYKTTRGAGAPADSFLLEMATVMHPAYKRLTLLDKMIEDRNQDKPNAVKSIKEMIHEKVIALAIEVAKEIDEAPSLDRTIDFDDAEVDPLADSFDRLVVVSEKTETAVRLEWQKYLHEIGDAKREHQKDILTWWDAHHSKNPYFSEVAKRLLPLRPRRAQ